MYEVIAILWLFKGIPVVVLEGFEYAGVGGDILQLYARQFLSSTNVRKILTQ
jgi:hypothetical protein